MTEPSGSPGSDIKKRLLALAGLVLIAGAAVGALSAAGRLGNRGGGEGISAVTLLDTPGASEDLAVRPEIGSLAPDFEVSAFDGTRHRLSDYRGKVVFVNLWATWCIFCQLEMPDLYKLENLHPDEVAVMSINRREPLQNAISFLENMPLQDGRRGVSFTVNGIDPGDTLYGEYRALGMPASYIIDPTGVIRRTASGPILLPKMEEILSEILAGAATAKPAN